MSAAWSGIEKEKKEKKTPFIQVPSFTRSFIDATTKKKRIGKKKKEELGLFILSLFKGGEGRRKAWDSGRRLGTMLFCKFILSDS